MDEGRRLARRLLQVLGPGTGVVNLAGGLFVAGYILLILPGARHTGEADVQAVRNTIAFAAYAVTGFAVHQLVLLRVTAPVRAWLVAGRPATEKETALVLRLPAVQVAINGSLWFAALAVFLPLNVDYSADLTADIGVSIVIGATSSGALGYLLSERAMRPVTARALTGAQAPSAPALGLTPKLLLAWGFGTGAPLVGLGLAIVERIRSGSMAQGGPLLFLVFLGLVSGIVAIVVAVRSVADPVESVTEAMARVERGRVDVEVPVYDGGEVGRLQHGFNAMVAGLREHQELQDLFGRQVGEDVARQALARGVHLGGEVVEVAVLFVDVIGSTSLAADSPPEQVVERLNEFFGHVVRAVDEAGGFVNKFQGDGALCLFGAPVHRPDYARRALVAARRLAAELADMRGLAAGIGVSAGPVVAGNVGTATRFEYTAIGDAVNEAARLTELAKREPGRLLASAAVVERAGQPEASHWRLAGSTLVRGRSTPTLLALPVEQPGSAAVRTETDEVDDGDEALPG